MPESNIKHGKQINAKIFQNQPIEKGNANQVKDDVISPSGSFTRWRIRKNILIISFAFLFMFTAYGSLQNLQSSLNKEEGIGTICLSIIYVCGMVSGLLLPPIVINKLGCKWSMVTSMLGYLLYMAANVYPVWGTMIPASILIGFGSAPLWSAKCTYLTKFGNWYAKHTGAVREGVISTFFGVFFMAFQTSQIWGNLISSTVFSVKVPDDRNVSNDALLACGADDCPGSYKNNTNLDRPNMTKIYTLCGIYIACAALAMIILAVFLDKLPEEDSKHSTKNESLILAIITHFWDSRFQKLLIPITVYSGVEQAFISGEFTRSFISCSIGVENVGYIMIVYGVFDAISSLIVGRFVSVTGFLPWFVLVLFLHGGSLVTFMIWKPQGGDMTLFYVFAGLWGIGDAIVQTLINALYGYLFTKNPAAGFASYRLYECAGFTIAFGYSSFLCTDIKIYVTLALLLTGFALYIIVEILHRRQIDDASGTIGQARRDGHKESITLREKTNTTPQ